MQGVAEGRHGKPPRAWNGVAEHAREATECTEAELTSLGNYRKFSRTAEPAMTQVRIQGLA